jgi:uncharacterized membrane protein (DUF2068 family)
MPPQPPPVFIAMVLLAILSLANLVPVEQVILEENPTVAPVFLPLVVGAWGLWRLKRWAMWLVIVVCVLNILMNALQITSPAMAIYVAIYIMVCALVILLAVLPNLRRACT